MWAAIITLSDRDKETGQVRTLDVVLVEADTKEEVETYLAERPKGFAPKGAPIRIEQMEEQADGRI